MIMRTLKVIAAAMLILSPIVVQAATCEQFKAGFVEGVAQYQVPAPKFRLDYVNSADADIQYWTINTFGDVRAAMSCWHGSVKTFMANANDSEITSSLHLLLLMGIGLERYGTEWHPALTFGTSSSCGEASEAQTAKLPIEGGGEASGHQLCWCAKFSGSTPNKPRRTIIDR